MSRDHFDYVWVIGFDPATLTTQPGLKAIFESDRTALYLINKKTPRS